MARLSEEDWAELLRDLGWEDDQVEDALQVRADNIGDIADEDFLAAAEQADPRGDPAAEVAEFIEERVAGGDVVSIPGEYKFWDGEAEIRPELPPRRALLPRAALWAHGFRGVLEFSFQHRDRTWTRWEGIAGDRGAILPFDDDEALYRRAYAILAAVRDDEHNNYAQDRRYAVRWRVLPRGRGAGGRHPPVFLASNEGQAVNCAQALLIGRFPAKRGKLLGVPLGPDRGWGYDQDAIAAGIIERNIERLDELGNRLYLVGGYKTDKKKRDVAYYAKDWHAFEEPPAHGRTTEVRAVPAGTDPYGLYAAARELRGGYAWFPRGDGLQVLCPGARDGDRPRRVLLRRADDWEAVRSRAAELSLEEAEVMDLSTPAGVERFAWRRRSGFCPTDEAVRACVREAEVFPVPYVSGIPANEVAAEGVDINQAYWASAARSPHWGQYGLPGGSRVVVRDPPLEGVLGRPGFVLVAVEPLHPYAALQMRTELAASTRRWLSTLRLRVWLDLAWVAVAGRPELAIVYEATFPDYEAAAPRGPNGEPPRRGWGREAIGALVARKSAAGACEEVLVPDEGDAHAMCEALDRAGRFRTVCPVLGRAPLGRAPPGVPSLTGSAEAVPLACTQAFLREQDRDLEEFLRRLEAPADAAEDAGLDVERVVAWRVIMASGESASGCYHAHCFFLDYAAERLERQLATYRWEDVARVHTDSILLRAGADYGVRLSDEPAGWKSEPRVRPGGKDRYTPARLRSGEMPGPRTSSSNSGIDPALVAEEEVCPRWWAPLLDPVHFVEGPPGYGKTTKCLAHLCQNALVLAPTHKLRRKAKAAGWRAATWQAALWPKNRLDAGRARQFLRGCSMVFITEALTVPLDRLRPIVAWLHENGYRVLMDGDPRQMRPFEGAFAYDWLRGCAAAARPAERLFAHAWAQRGVPRTDIQAEDGAKDHRSLDGATAALKLAVRQVAHNNDAVVDLLKFAWADYGSFLAEWHPRDVVLASVHELRRRVHADLLRLHAEKFPGEPMRVRYGSVKANNAGGVVASPDKVGDEEEIPLGAPTPKGAELAYSVTYSACQGDTVEPPQKVWLFAHRLRKYPSAVYTGATRVRALSQLRVVFPPAD
jgi:hypothetical protein